MRIKSLAVVVTIAAAAIGLSACAQPSPTPVVAPVVMDVNDLQGKTVDLVVGQVLDIDTGSLAVDSYSGEVEDDSRRGVHRGPRGRRHDLQPRRHGARGGHDRSRPVERGRRHRGRHVHRGRRIGLTKGRTPTVGSIRWTPTSIEPHRPSLLRDARLEASARLAALERRDRRAPPRSKRRHRRRRARSRGRDALGRVGAADRAQLGRCGGPRRSRRGAGAMGCRHLRHLHRLRSRHPDRKTAGASRRDALRRLCGQSGRLSVSFAKLGAATAQSRARAAAASDSTDAAPRCCGAARRRRRSG